MKKIKCIFSIILCCGISICGGCSAKKDWAIAEEKARLKWLKEYRMEAKKIFPDMLDYNQITPKHFEQYENGYMFMVRFSHFIYGSGDEFVKFPIFRGTMGDVLSADFVEYCYAKGLMRRGIAISCFYVELEKGEYNKVLEEFKEFYGARLSINFKEKPTEVSYVSMSEKEIFYDFTLDGYKGTLSFFLIDEKYRNEQSTLDYLIYSR